MRFDTLTYKTETITTFNSEVFNDFVLMSILYDRTTLGYLSNDPIRLSKSQNKIEFVITKKRFDEYVECYGTNPDWISYGGDKCVEVPVNKEYLQNYLDGKRHIDVPFESEDSVRSVLENGEFYRLLINKENGFLYDLNGKPVLRKFVFYKYIDPSLWHMDELIKHLKKQTGVSEINYCTDETDNNIYNFDDSESSYLTFVFTPTQDQFDLMHKNGNAYCMELVIEDILGLRQFSDFKILRSE